MLDVTDAMLNVAEDMLKCYRCYNLQYTISRDAIASKKTLIVAIFVNMKRMVVMANLIKMAVIAVMEYYELVSNMVYIGVFLLKSKIAEMGVLFPHP